MRKSVVKKLLVLLVTCALMLPVLAGCSSTTPQAPAAKPDASKPAGPDADQYINTYLTANPSTLDISRRSDSYSNAILVNTMEGLIRTIEKDGKYEISPGDAKTWTSNPEGTVWTFKLGDNKWQDGQPVKAQDYVYSLQRSADPKTGSPNGYFLAPLKNYDAISKKQMDPKELGVKAVDDKTLEITLAKPVPSFLNMIDGTIYYPQREDKIKEWGEKYGSEAKYAIGNGPFKVETWTANSSIVLTKNDNYWDAKTVQLKKVNYAIMTDETTYYNAYESGQIDFVSSGKTEWVDRFKKRDDSNYNSYTSATMTYAFFNTKDPIFKNLNIRKAFSLAVDREDINKMCFSGLRVPTYGWVVPTISVGSSNFRQAAGDPIKTMQADLKAKNQTAKDLLLQGMQELGLGNDPSKLKITFSLAGTDDWYRTLGEYLQQTYKKQLGVEMQISFAEWGIFYDNVTKGTYQIGFMGWGAYYNDPYDVLSLFTTENNMIKTGWSNKTFDDLIAKGSVTMDEKQRLQTYVDAEKLLIQDMPVAPLATSRVDQFVRKYVNGYAKLGFSKMGFKYVSTTGRK